MDVQIEIVKPVKCDFPCGINDPHRSEKKPGMMIIDII